MTSKVRFPLFRAAGLCTVALFALSFAACKPSGRSTVPVTGTVTFDRHPAARALVIFHPVDAKPDAVKPHGEVAADGTFTLSTFGSGDGAPPGQYLVTVEWWLTSGRAGDESPPVNRLPAHYAVAATSGLKAHVANGRTELPPFELKP